MASATEIEAMRRALTIAERGLGTCSPNPAVGCVIIADDGTVIAEGWHQRAGEAHAEVVALTNAGQKARGATAVVTLEPCAHTGRTGPCTQALIDAGIARVVFGASDRGRNSAGGAQLLSSAGLSVEGGVLLREAAELIYPWSVSQGLERPFVRVKIASSLDGRVSGPAGQMLWITGPEARSDGHRLRAVSDAVLVGTGTVNTDDPQLTVRDVDEHLEFTAPLRCVMGLGPVSAEARVRGLSGGANPASEHGSDGLFRHLRTHDPQVVVADLWNQGVHSLLVEGGPTVISAFLSAGLVDEVVQYVAPIVLGAGRHCVESLTVRGAHGGQPSPVALDLRDVVTMGADIRLTARPVPAPWSGD